jgi:hypothetical protein
MKKEITLSGETMMTLTNTSGISSFLALCLLCAKF